MNMLSFNDVEFGEIFYKDAKKFIKISPVEDKWGNVFIACDLKSGNLMDNEQIKNDCLVFKTIEKV